MAMELDKDTYFKAKGVLMNFMTKYWCPRINTDRGFGASTQATCHLLVDEYGEPPNIGGLITECACITGVDVPTIHSYIITQLNWCFDMIYLYSEPRKHGFNTFTTTNYGTFANISYDFGGVANKHKDELIEGFARGVLELIQFGGN